MTALWGYFALAVALNPHSPHPSAVSTLTALLLLPFGLLIALGTTTKGNKP